MFSKPSVRTWLSPLVAVLFSMIALTGILMWLEVRVPGVKSLHEVGGLIFVGAGVFHVVSNWRALTGYFRTRTAWLTLAAGTTVCAIVIGVGAIAGAGREGERDGHDRHERQEARQGRPSRT